MNYCTIAEVFESIKPDAMNMIIGDSYIKSEQERKQKIEPIISAAIADAEGEVNGYLAKRYPVPLVNVPRVISKFTKDIAIYNLFSRAGIDESEREKNYLNRYKAAIDFFKLLSDGKVDIGITPPKQSAKTGFSTKSNKRLFGRDSMRGM